MRIGIDFDNTIVCYDQVFHKVALEQGLIPADLPATKERVRDHLRATGREPAWTAMQGHVYGERMADVDPFPGALAFFRACRERDIAVFVISHKTRTPYAGPPHDLHAAALGWMDDHGFFDPERLGLTREHVFLEPTKRDKLLRIGAQQCTHFIDDLPEFLAEAEFPASARRIHFAPRGGGDPRFDPAAGWDEIAARLLGA
ncbi:hypothetical protein [Pseudodesulfovibrio sp.]|uniref:hypothetical protein n=1 Tax=Pseudodesulfovibrio sp. TaxID=2035812 RepID=UPI00260AACE5|nr:hypothetical protein [Pseudodesulfovibrio sp.]MDD3312110.1 hypothetical protein [Pseudodesulfovibrio sp.]